MEEDKTDNPARPAPVRLAFRVSYLGSRFFGSQMQASSRTVEGEFIAACRRLGLFEDWRQAGFSSAGRTDRGVHARGQVIAFSTDARDRAIGTINLQLPPDLWCSAYAEVPAEFHPRYDAKSRTYRYYFPEVPPELEEMEKAARHFLGLHDFSHFARVGDRNPKRTILATRVAWEDGFVYFEVTAESFLWHQVRCMASALLRVGYGGTEEESILQYLKGETDKPLSPAPAEGLVLWETNCGLSWSPFPEGERSSSFMDHLCRHHALMEKVCRILRSP
ncbi:MAG: tRNA pseudouridine(38-40) synthase TruA [Methanoregula sp.]|nr:tRNA pseudouridine(38-40) synthase TruA [Methanoregula sp.]